MSLAVAGLLTGNLLRAIDQLTSKADREAAHGARTMLAVCLTFLLGAIVGGGLTVRLGAISLIFPLSLLASALWLCRHLAFADAVPPCGFVNPHPIPEARPPGRD